MNFNLNPNEAQILYEIIQGDYSQFSVRCYEKNIDPERIFYQLNEIASKPMLHNPNYVCSDKSKHNGYKKVSYSPILWGT